MINRRTFCKAIGFLLLALAHTDAMAQVPQRLPIVLAHYMPWFVAKPSSPVWGWHWTMNAFDPEKMRMGRREIASHYYPLIGPYDSGTPNVQEYHLLLMKLTGIDGIVVDWYGLTDFADYPIIQRNTLQLLKLASRIGMKIAICYEDQTVPHLIEAKRIASTERVSHVQKELEWLQHNFFADPAYLNLAGKPVLLSFGNDGLTDTEWKQVLTPMHKSLLYLSEHHRRLCADGTFDWPVPSMGLTSIDRYYETLKIAPASNNQAKPVAMPIVFPRFHDIYKEGKAQEGYPEIPDENGQTLIKTLERALSSDAPLIQIATWNDWGEGTGIEPTVEFGYRDLETIQKALRSFRTGKSSQSIPTASDLRLPYRLWKLRERQKSEPGLQAPLDMVSKALATGDLTNAKKVLASLPNAVETSH